MDVIELLPSLRVLRFDFGQAYLWNDAGELTLIDTGVAGSGPLVAEAVRGLGLAPGALRRVVLTHSHQDHAGSAAEIGGWDGVTVLAHRLDAPVIRGDAPEPPPDLTDAPDWERDLFAGLPALPPAPHARVDRELEDGDVLDFGGGAHVVAAPGHTAGSIAIHLPGPGVLFTGDAAASAGGSAMLGVFNVERPRAVASLGRLAELDAEVACFGHGDPITGGASAALRAAAKAAGGSA